MAKIITAESVREIRLKKNAYINPQIFVGSAKHNLDTKTPEKRNAIKGGIEVQPVAYNGSAGQEKLYDKIEKQIKQNAVKTPSAEDIETLMGLFLVDVSRKAAESRDLTSFIAKETTALNDPELVTLQNVLPYRGIMREISGNGESVSLIQPATASNDNMQHKIYGVGYQSSLRQILFDPWYNTEKVLTAAVDSDTDNRNKAIIGAIVGTTYVASQSQAADTTGTSYDVKNYNTFRKAIKKLRALKDFNNDRKISVPSITLLCNSADSWDIQRVINGQLAGSNGTIAVQNMQSLPIANILEYDQGINNGFTIGKEEAAFPGVTQGTCYIFVPNEYLFVRNKRPLTMETSAGSALSLSQEEKAWYRIFGVYDKLFFGSSYSGTALDAGYGAIVKITLPTDS